MAVAAALQVRRHTNPFDGLKRSWAAQSTAMIAGVRRHTNPFDGLKPCQGMLRRSQSQCSKAHKSVRRIETEVDSVLDDWLDKFEGTQIRSTD